MVEPSSRIEEFKIPLTEPVHGLASVPGVLGVPRWWPTGSRVCVVLAHGANSDYTDPLIEYLQRELTERRYLTLRFNFPFAEAQKTRPDPLPVLRRTFRSALGAIARDPTAAPAHLVLCGMGLGAQAAADVAGARARVDALVLLGFPLHPQGKPEKVQPETLFRIVSPMLFLQGTRDQRCDLDVLRRTLDARRRPDRAARGPARRSPFRRAQEIRPQARGGPRGAPGRDRRLDPEGAIGPRPGAACAAPPGPGAAEPRARPSARPATPRRGAARAA